MSTQRLFGLVAWLLCVFAFASANADVIPGKSAGQVSVTLSGSSQFTMPFEFPAGTAGMAPKLFLSYDSNSGPGAFGLGWSLTGLTQITRVGRTADIDGFPAAVDFDDAADGFAADALSLDGVRLVPAPEDSAYLSKSIDDQTRVWQIGDHFAAKTKAGLTLFFGESENARIRTMDGSVLTWAVSRIEDTFGNQIVFLYRQKGGDWGPRRIFWTLHRSQLIPVTTYDEATLESLSFASAIFKWSEASNADSVSFLGGEELRRSGYITDVTSFVRGREFRRYEFDYEGTDRLGARVLKSIREIGADLSPDRNEYGSTVFSYTSFVPAWNEAAQYGLPTDFGTISPIGTGFRLVDLDIDGGQDLLYSAHVGGQTVRRAFHKESVGWKTLDDFPPTPLEVDFSTNGEDVDPIVFFDVTGDGRKDLLVSRKVDGVSQNAAYIQANQSWQLSEQLAPPFTLVSNAVALARVVEIDDNGTRKLLVWKADGSATLHHINNGTWDNEILHGEVSIDPQVAVHRKDFRCDGSALLASVTAGGRSLVFFELTAGRTGNRLISPVAEFESDAAISDMTVLDSGTCAKIAVTSGAGASRALTVVSVAGDEIVKERVDNGAAAIGVAVDVFAADVHGGGADSIGLLLPAGPGERNIVFFSFDGSSAWELDPGFAYTSAGAESAVDGSYRLEVVKIDADAQDDILLLPNAAGITARALINYGSGFIEAVSLVPDVEFTREGAVGASPQFVDINADGLTDLLGYHVDRDGRTVINTAQVNTLGGWSGIQSLRLPQPITSEKGGTVGAFVDFNSDGIVDFLHAGPDASKWGAWTIDFDGQGNPLRWIPAPGYILPLPAKLSDENLGDLGVRFFDLNADAKVDVVVSRREANGTLVRYAALNTGTQWSMDTPAFHPPIPFVSRHPADVRYETKSAQGDYYRNLRIHLSDLNGDGLTDLLFRYGFQPATGGTASSMVPRREGCLNTPTYITSQSGRRVYQEHPISSTRYCAGLYYLSKHGWRAGSEAHFPPVQLDLNIVLANASIDILDINGDGLVDIIPARLANNKNQYTHAYLNTAKSWASSASYAIPPAALAADERLGNHRMLDLNGDGLVDIAYSRPGASGTFLNTGVSFLPASPSFAPPRPFINDKGEDLGIRFVDVDGNGMPDLLESFRSNGSTLTQSAFLNSGQTTAEGVNSPEDRADMLKTVTNSMGLVTTLQYQSLLTPRGRAIRADDFYTPSPISPPPIITYVPTMYAVRSMDYADSDGSRIGTRYQYEGFRFDVVASVPLGFERRTASSFVVRNGGGLELTGVVEEIELHQSYELNGRTKREIAIIDGVTTSDTEMGYSIAVDGVGNWPKRVVTSSTAARTADLNGDATGTTTQLFTYDRYNNTEQVCVEYGDGSRTLTVNSYDNAPDLLHPNVWLLGRLTQAEVTHFRTTAALACADLLKGFSGVPPGEFLTSAAVFEYDIRRDAAGTLLTGSTGVLTSETAHAGHPLEVRKTYRHDKFGNVVEERATTADLPPRIKTMQYSGDGRFLASEINALGHTVTFEYDDLLGVVIRTTNPNGVSARAAYDGLGRAIETISPTGVSSIDSREFDDTVEVGGRRSKFRQRQQVGSLAETVTYFDFQGRALRVDQKGFAGRRVYQDSLYDERGRPVSVSLPYFADELATYWSHTSYDNVGRPILVTAPDGGETRTKYAGLVTIVTDANGKTATKRVNEKGLTVETIDNTAASLRFVYGPADRLLKTIQVDGLETTNLYDAIGNKIASTDPDLGSWDYRYNGFGEIVWQRDAKGQITAITYDILGRPVARHMPDRLDEFTYDTAVFGLGMPANVSSSEGYEERYTYDRYGRLQRKSTRLDDELFSTFLEYDEYDRVTVAAHPGNYTVWNEFDKEGSLARVLANDPLAPLLTKRTVYWTALSRDQYGRVTEEKVGNGAVTSYSYDPRQGNLQATFASHDGEAITDLAFEYDLVGNLLAKTDDVAGRTEEYRYDDLDRVSQWIVDGRTKGHYRHDAVGRILSKTDIGDYAYGSGGTGHGVSQIVTPNGERWEYAYDANGNMVSGPKGHFAYYANNAVRLVYASKDQWSRFRYAPDGSRIFHHYSETRADGKNRSVTDVVVTVSIGAYERISDLGGPFIVKPGGFQRHRLYLSADTGVVAVLEHSTEFDPLHAELDVKREMAGTALASAVTTSGAHYLHKDHLGSIIRVTDAFGAQVSSYEYDPWGKKTQTRWLEKGKQDFANHTLRRGFTGHEHLDNLALIHMNGRVFDPDIARFISADPHVQLAQSTQGYDRYAYALNNPLVFTDATGFFIDKVFKAIGGIVRAILSPIVKAFDWIKKNWRTVVVITVAVVASTFTAGIGGAILVGALSGGLNAALYGGDFKDILKSALIGAASGAAFYGAGELALGVGEQSGSFWAETAAGSAGHGVVGGIEAEINGGEFWSGFASAAVTKAFASPIGRIRGDALQTIAASAIGGTASVIGGGKFENGAITGAYSHLLNDSMHKAKEQSAASGQRPDYSEDAIYPTWSPIDLAIGTGAFFWRSIASMYGSFTAATGGISAWIRLGPSKNNGTTTNWSVRLGSTKHWRKTIGNPELRKWNESLRNFDRGPFNKGHWDVVGPGLWSPGIVPPPASDKGPTLQ